MPEVEEGVAVALLTMIWGVTLVMACCGLPMAEISTVAVATGWETGVRVGVAVGVAVGGT